MAAQVVEFHALREEDERLYDLDIQQRVYIQVKPLNFVAYYPEEVESAPPVPLA
jgi:hypothetical protein